MRPTDPIDTSTRVRARAKLAALALVVLSVVSLATVLPTPRRAVEPLVPATASLQAGGLGCLEERAVPYFRDVHDHVVRASEHIGAMSELLDSVLSSNLAQVSMRQNEDMRKISAWVAIAAVSTLIAGIYGMNFDVMPELRWRFGYPYALALMAVCSWLLYRGFRRNHWL